MDKQITKILSNKKLSGYEKSQLIAKRIRERDLQKKIEKQEPAV